jgi:hypothetical protein
MTRFDVTKLQIEPETILSYDIFGKTFSQQVFVQHVILSLPNKKSIGCVPW